jgi:hypothetical protein
VDAVLQLAAVPVQLIKGVLSFSPFVL